jgi:hypothetical protein
VIIDEYLNLMLNYIAKSMIIDDGDTCIAAAPSKPHVRKTSFEAAAHDFPLMKNSLQTVAGKS